MKSLTRNDLDSLNLNDPKTLSDLAKKLWVFGVKRGKLFLIIKLYLLTIFKLFMLVWFIPHYWGSNILTLCDVLSNTVFNTPSQHSQEDEQPHRAYCMLHWPRKSHPFTKPLHQTLSPNPFTKPLHQTPSPNPFTKPLHRTPSPNPFTKPLYRTPSPNPFTKPLHQTPSPNPFTKLLHQTP